MLTTQHSSPLCLLKHLFIFLLAYTLLLTPHLFFVVYFWTNNLDMASALGKFIMWDIYLALASCFILMITSCLFYRAFLALILFIANAINSAFMLSYSIQNAGFNDAFFSQFTWSTIAHVGILYYVLGTLYFFIVVLACSVCFWYPAVLRSTFKKNKTLSFLQHVLVIAFFIAIGFIINGSRFVYSIKYNYLISGKLQNQADILWNKYPILKKQYDHTPNPTPPKHKMNVIWILIESYDQGYLKYPGIAPNLNKFRSHSLYFDNVKQLPEISDTEFGHFAQFCGIWVHTDPIFPHALKGKIHHICLPNILAKAGWHTVNLDGENKSFMDTDHRLETVGFEEDIGYNDLKGKYGNYPTNKRFHGLFDEDTYKVAWNKISSLAKKKQPFFIALATIDNHNPFESLSKACDTLPPAHNTSEVIRKSGRCTDKTLGAFLKKLKASPLINKNTMIVITNDHLNPWQDATIKALKIPQKKRRLLFMINFPNNKYKVIHNVGTHYDIGPTVLSALGFKGDTSLAFGQSLLTHKKGFLYSHLTEEEADIISWGRHLADR